MTALGIDIGAEVTEAQMKSLFGLGRHPNAETIEAAVYDRQIHLGAKHKDAARAAENASRLGNPFRVHAEVSEFRKRCEQTFREHNCAHGRDPTAAIPHEERARIRTHVCASVSVTERYTGEVPVYRCVQRGRTRPACAWMARVALSRWCGSAIVVLPS
ncbi:hypothetical protein ABZV58_10280 [Nocardia sp. NPDC004654]|uniref:hypothetical protein n=1 Tax=Nocardia sp. NPDC004654 TaxID=3154776 RepID=UPI0033AC264D